MSAILNFQRHFLSVACCATVAFLLPSQVRAEKTLEWKFQPGETLRYVMTQEMNQKINLGETPIKLDLSQTIDMSWKVKSVEDGVASIEQTIDRMRMKMQSQQGLNLDYDTASDQEPEGLAKTLAPLFGALVKKPIAMKINRHGELSDVQVPQELTDELKKMPGMEQVGGMFSEDGMRQMLGLSSLPKEAISPDKTWTRETAIAVPLFGKQQIENQYKYEATEKRDNREVEVIGSSSKIKFVPDAQSTAKFEIKDQSTQGTIYFDNAAGRIVESSAKTKSKATVSVAGTKFDQEMDMNVVLKLEPEKK